MESTIAQCHAEVLDALATVASETGMTGRGELVRADRRSQYQYLGLRTPDRRRRVARGFSFTSGADQHVLTTWDGIWNDTDNGDVLFAVLDFYLARGVDHIVDDFWRTSAGWIDRVDNWAHADDLARLYSYALEADRDGVYPTLEQWSHTESEWRRRVSVVSLIHYSGKNAVFMPIEPCLDLVANCVADPRDTVSKAVGWVLRELLATYPDEVTEFLQLHVAAMPAPAFRRATERLPAEQRQRLRSARD
ncbi:MAG: DNA alkylation repair protein [Actinomycetota bacterium]